MKANKAIKSALETLGVPVSRIRYDGKSKTYLVYQLIIGREAHHNDDDASEIENLFRVDLFSKGDYTTLLENLVQSLRSAGFYGISVDGEIYEEDTGYFHVPVECKYLEV